MTFADVVTPEDLQTITTRTLVLLADDDEVRLEHAIETYRKRGRRRTCCRLPARLTACFNVYEEWDSARRRANSAASDAGPQWALSPLGLGNTHTCVAPIVSSCGPTMARGLPNEVR